MTRWAVLAALSLAACAQPTCGAIGHGAVGTAAVGAVRGAADEGPPGTPDSWYAARLETAYSNNDLVPTATDFGANEWDATQGTSTRRPTYKDPCEAGKLNELPCFDLDGGDRLDTGTKTVENQKFILAAVLRYDAAATDVIVDGNAEDSWLYQISDDYRAYAGTGSLGSVTITQGEYTKQCFYAANSFSVNNVNGTEATGNAGVNGVGGLVLGADPTGTFATDGALAEVLYYSDPDAQGVDCDDVMAFFDEIYGSSWPQ